MFDDEPRGACLPGLPVEEQTLKYKFQLTNDEYQELALFKFYGHYLYTKNYIFRDQICAARLGHCLKEMDWLDAIEFRRRVNYFKSRTELRRRPYIQRGKMERTRKQEQERAKRQREMSTKRIIAVGTAEQEGEERAWLPRESYVQRLVAVEEANKEPDEESEDKEEQRPAERVQPAS